MILRLALLGLLSTTCSPLFGQGRAFFQNGVTELPGGSLYEGTIDTEFRASAAGTGGDLSETQFISVDGDDNGFQTQAAIRFENLLISDGGLVPDELPREGILFAEFQLWKDSPSEPDADIPFNRVLGPDTKSGDIWQEDDTWVTLGGDLIPDEFGFLDGSPINWEDGVEAATEPDFRDSPSRFSDDQTVVLDPDDGPVPASMVYGTNRDSENVFEDAWDGTPADLPRAIGLATWRFDVTEVIRDWLADADSSTPGTQPASPNYGWSISNNTGDGWDMVTSEIIDVFDDRFDGLDIAQFRPALTILFDDGSAGPLDIDKDTDIDLDDYELFLGLIGGELDEPLNTGSPGDFDFDRDVDLDDFKFFKNEFPGGPEGLAKALAAAQAPEPASLLLALAAVAGGLALRGRAMG